MGLIPKQPVICVKWPWDSHQSTKTPSPYSFESPWLFKSSQNLGAFAFNFVNSALKLPSANFSSFNPLQLDEKTGQKKKLMLTRKSVMLSEQGEAEQRAFVLALAIRKEATVTEFYSPKRSLCNSLLNFVSEVETRNSDWLNIVMADAKNEKWLPEYSALIQSRSHKGKAVELINQKEVVGDLFNQLRLALQSQSKNCPAQTLAATNMDDEELTESMQKLLIVMQRIDEKIAPMLDADGELFNKRSVG